MTTDLTLQLDPALRARLDELQEVGQEIFHRFDLEVRQHAFHPFVPSDYASILRALLPLRANGLRFLEWGSGTGVITIMADLIGFEAYGIEIDTELCAIARDLAKRFHSNARFAAGSYLPTGYQWRSKKGDPRLGTIGQGDSGYIELGHPLEDFDLVYGYPWDGEMPIMQDIMRRYGAPDARLLINGSEGVQIYNVRGALI